MLGFKFTVYLCKIIIIWLVLTHQYDAGSGGGELEQEPFIAVGSPHAEPVAFCQSKRQQPGCSSIHLQAPNEEQVFV